MKTKFRKTMMAGILLFVSTAYSFGQLQVGAVTGINCSTQSRIGNLYDNDNICSSFNAGLLSRYKFNDWLALRGSVIYTEKGIETETNSLKTTDKYSYLEVPVKAEFSTSLGKPNLFASTGPYISFLLDAKNKFNNSTTDISNQAKSTDYGISLELGVELPIAKQSLLISLNYDMGLVNISEIENDVYNKTLSLNIGVLF